MKRIFISALVLAVAVVSIHCEADDPAAVNENASLIGADTITDTTTIADSSYVISDTVVVSDTIVYPDDSVGVSEPGYPGDDYPGDATDTITVPSDSSAVGWRIKGRK
ncbi:hypothetical protein ACLI1A_08875 [Flavobacterium sp. RHBU_3]|uniref:hypothetical protein n=1 Tax=Flavobacterium sp. RHBU_3 TaxID=3391184 RepID=UPI0039847672